MCRCSAPHCDLCFVSMSRGINDMPTFVCSPLSQLCVSQRLTFAFFSPLLLKNHPLFYTPSSPPVMHSGVCLLFLHTQARLTSRVLCNQQLLTIQLQLGLIKRLGARGTVEAGFGIKAPSLYGGVSGPQGECCAALYSGISSFLWQAFLFRGFKAAWTMLHQIITQEEKHLVEHNADVLPLDDSSR